MGITSPSAKSESRVCIQDVFAINILYKFKKLSKNRKFFGVELIELHANLKRCYFTCCGCVWFFLKKVIFYFYKTLKFFYQRLMSYQHVKFLLRN